MVLVRYAGLVVALATTARQASGFGLGIGVATRSVDARTRTGATVTPSRERCGCGGTGAGGFASAAAEGIWGITRGTEGQGSCGNGGVAMMNRGNRGAAQEEQWSEGMTPQQTNDLPVCDMEDDPTLAEVITACKAGDERKAENIVALRVAQLTAVTEYMVVLEGNSRPQNQAIAQNIEDKMMEAHNREPKTQGSPESGWILLDYGDIIVHVMTPKSRSYYDLESFWANGTPVPLEAVLTPNVVPTEAPVQEEVDPFWS